MRFRQNTDSCNKRKNDKTLTKCYNFVIFCSFGGVNQIRITYKVSKISVFKTSLSLMYNYSTAYF